MTNGNGFTNKELLNIIIDGQKELNERIDLLHEKVNSKISRQELSGWLVAGSALVVLVNALMQEVIWNAADTVAAMVVSSMFNYATNISVSK